MPSGVASSGPLKVKAPPPLPPRLGGTLQRTEQGRALPTSGDVSLGDKVVELSVDGVQPPLLSGLPHVDVLRLCVPQGGNQRLRCLRV